MMKSSILHSQERFAFQSQVSRKLEKAPVVTPAQKLALLVQCRLLFLQWKSTLIRTSQRRRQNIIYTFKRENISRNEDEKGVKDVYQLHDPSCPCDVCLFFLQKWPNPHCSPLLKSQIEIDSSRFASNLSSYGHAFFDVDKVFFS
jgi:hypothetical protein